MNVYSSARPVIKSFRRLSTNGICFANSDRSQLNRENKIKSRTRTKTPNKCHDKKEEENLPTNVMTRRSGRKTHSVNVFFYVFAFFSHYLKI